MTVFEIYNSVLVKIGADRWGNKLTVPDFNLLAQLINLTLFKVKYGKPEDYQPGQALSQQAFEITQKLTDDISKFKVTMGENGLGYLPINNNGIAKIPLDYAHASSMLYPTGNSKKPFRLIEILDDDKYGTRESASLTKPTKKNPVCNFQSGYIRFLPNNLTRAKFTYLRYPLKPNLVVTVNEDDDRVFDETASTNFEWPETVHPDIVNMIAYIVSNKMKDQVLLQAETIRKQQGS